MPIHDKIAVSWIIVSLLLVFTIYFRSLKTQRGAKLRLQVIRDDSKAQFQEGMEVSRKQLEVLQAILDEMKALRLASENKASH